MIPQQRKILVVAKDEPFTDETIQFSIQLAKRLGYELIALHIRNLDDKKDDSSALFNARAIEENIPFEYLTRSGDLESVVGEFQHQLKRVEFVITGFDEEREKLSEMITVPVFSINSNPQLLKRRKMMAKRKEGRKKILAKTIGFGLATGALYAAVFTNSGTIMTYFTKGSWYAALPIVTVFVFSLVHGTFASNVWSLLGISAMKKDEIRPVIPERTRTRQRPRRRPRLYAYVNPFHRI